MTARHRVQGMSKSLSEEARTSIVQPTLLAAVQKSVGSWECSRMVIIHKATIL